MVMYQLDLYLAYFCLTCSVKQKINKWARSRIFIDPKTKHIEEQGRINKEDQSLGKP